MKILDKNLLAQANAIVGKKKLTDDVTVGHVSCAIRTKSGKVFSGISVGTSANLGFCAEVSAIAQMIKEGETQIDTVAAVGEDNNLITPCGRCRELIYQINYSNLKAKFLLPKDKIITLKDLLPFRWQEYL